jgi:rubrerythrin
VPSTQDNLEEAFAGESQANQRYMGFGKRAQDEGYPMVARLFRAAAAAETVHAQNHMRAMKGVRATLDNLKAGVAGEAAEFGSMYPAFLRAAREEGNQDAETTFDYALQVEQIHHGLYGRAVEALEGGSDLPEQKAFVCRGCGNTVLGEAPQKCPICGAPRSWFMDIE